MLAELTTAAYQRFQDELPTTSSMIFAYGLLPSSAPHPAHEMRQDEAKSDLIWPNLTARSTEERSFKRQRPRLGLEPPSRPKPSGFQSPSGHSRSESLTA